MIGYQSSERGPSAKGYTIFVVNTYSSYYGFFAEEMDRLYVSVINGNFCYSFPGFCPEAAEFPEPKFE